MPFELRNDVWYYCFNPYHFVMLNSAGHERSADIKELFNRYNTGSRPEILNLWRGIWYDYSTYYLMKFKSPLDTNFAQYLDFKDRNLIQIGINGLKQWIRYLNNQFKNYPAYIAHMSDEIGRKYDLDIDESYECYENVKSLVEHLRFSISYYPLPGYQKPIKSRANPIDPFEYPRYDIKPRPVNTIIPIPDQKYMRQYLFDTYATPIKRKRGRPRKTGYSSSRNLDWI